MMSKKQCSKKIVTLCLSLILSACAANQSQQSDAALQQGGKQAGQSAYLWVSESAEYQWNTQLIYQAAANRVYQYLGGKKEGKWGVFLDLDQTVLDNTGFQQLLLERKATYDQLLWDEWVKMEQASLVPGALVFIEEVKRLGGLVVFVSNRAHYLQQATENNLLTLSVPYDEMFLRSGRRNKTARWHGAMKNIDFTPVLWLGDQVTDFPLFDEDYDGDDCPAFAAAYSYNAPTDAFLSEQLGRCIFVVANPVYGTWNKR